MTLQAKTFSVMENVGRARYLVNFNTGVNHHRDGSPFIDVRICRNKRTLNKTLRDLRQDGYRDRND